MTTKYLAFRAWKKYCLAILNEILDRPFGLFDHGVTAGSVQWNSVGRAIEGRKDHRSLKLSFPTLEYHTLLREAVEDAFWICLRNMRVTEGMLEQLEIRIEGAKLVVVVQGPGKVLSLLEEKLFQVVILGQFANTKG